MKKTLIFLALTVTPIFAQVNGKFAKVDATQGYTVNGAAPNNQTLCGNGTAFTPATACPIAASTAGALAATPHQCSGSTPLATGVAANGDANCAAAPAAPSRTCNSNGCYRISADGTIEEWGTLTVPPAGTGTNTATITFPHPFTSTTNLAPTLNTIGVAGSGDPNDPPGAQLSSLSTTGAAVFMARFIQASEGGGSFNNTITVSWHAIGN